MRLMIFLAFLAYMVFTLLLVCTVIGFFVVHCDPADNWYKLGHKLLDGIRVPNNDRR